MRRNYYAISDVLFSYFNSIIIIKDFNSSSIHSFKWITRKKTREELNFTFVCSNINTYPSRTDLNDCRNRTKVTAHQKFFHKNRLEELNVVCIWTYVHVSWKRYRRELINFIRKCIWNVRNSLDNVCLAREKDIWIRRRTQKNDGVITKRNIYMWKRRRINVYYEPRWMYKW